MIMPMINHVAIILVGQLLGQIVIMSAFALRAVLYRMTLLSANFVEFPVIAAQTSSTYTSFINRLLDRGSGSCVRKPCQKLRCYMLQFGTFVYSSLIAINSDR